MIEAIAASLLNRYLGRYIQNLDSENINVGIFSGKVELLDLKLRPEALAELDLPIEVKAGSVGRIELDIPWTALYSQPVILKIEDVFALAGPISERPYDERKERQLQRAVKQRKLDELDGQNILNFVDDDEALNLGFFEKLMATVVNNLQVYIRKIHIRYEDSVSNDTPFGCGIVIHSLLAETTNNKWKPTQVDGNAMSVYKLLKLESLSLYWNPFCTDCNLTNHQMVAHDWLEIMKRGLETFNINEEVFDFIMKPISAKVKVIINKSNEAKVPKLLLDFVLQDVATQLSRQQYLSANSLIESLLRMKVNERYRKYQPTNEVKGHAKEWWHYAYKCVIEESIRPYSWDRIKQHRDRFREYRNLFKEYLRKRNDSEIKVDLHKQEDYLDLINIVIAREQARSEFAKEEPDRVLVKKAPKSWWSSWFSYNDDEDELEVVSERDKNIWSQLTPEDKQKIYDAIGYTEGEKYPEKPKQYTEHKLNFTFANCSLSLINYEKEILVVSLTQLLLSLETRPSANAFHLSARAESFSIEGASIENDLVPLITTEHVTHGSTLTCVFSADFDMNPSHLNADYGLVIHSESIEMVYHEHSMSEILSFLRIPSTCYDDVKTFATSKFNQIVQASRAAAEYAIETHKKIHLSVDIKSPYIIVPEHGTMQKGGCVIVFDFGHLSVKSDLQTDSRLLEEATKTELEERLYDRFHVTVSDVQVLFADSGDEWRAARTLPESESHLIPKLCLQIIFSNSVKQDYRQLPRQKLNLSIPTLKLNLSDRRVRLLADFVLNLPVPRARVCSMTDVDSVDGVEIEREVIAMNLSEVIIEPKTTELKRVQRVLRFSYHDRESENFNAALPDSSMTRSDVQSSDHSDEEVEPWARTVDLPGFEDNISPSNTIITLLRFLVGEIVVQLARSSDHVDKPYLMLRIDKLCTDVALMECGPALQANLGGIQLVDKLHTSTTGEYLELISSRNNADMITVLYRKVRSNCPDFKTFFHSVEQSIVIEFTVLHLIFHRGAFLTLSKFLEYIIQRVSEKDSRLQPSVSFNAEATQLLLADERDPPVPPGATKFSISARLDEVKVKLCDSDLDFASICVAGLEADFVLKANEKMVLRAQLTDLSIEDLSELTLYSKIVQIKEDKLFDFKFVRNSPSHHKQKEIDKKKEMGSSDGSIKLRIGKVQVTLLHKFLTNLQRFLEPFIKPRMTTMAVKSVEKEITKQVVEMKNRGTQIHLSIDIHAPTILIPQKSDSPNMLVLSLGNLTVENFFQDVTVANSETKYIVEYLLLRLSSVEMSRVAISLNGTYDVQEFILEPIKLRLDLKRSLAPFHKEILLYDVQGHLEVVKMRISQKDLGLFLAILNQNFTEGQFRDVHLNSHPTSPEEIITPPAAHDDTMVKKLQAFLTSSNEVYKEINANFTLEGMNITLYTSSCESLPLAQTSNYGLCCLEMDEMSLLTEIYNDKSVKVKCALQAVTLEDIRSEKRLAVRKIFQSYSGDSKVDMGMISVSMPPMIDITWKKSKTGDMEMDVLIEKTRLNISVPFILSMMRFLYDALPAEKSSIGGIVNPGFSSELMNQNRELVATSIRRRRQASSSDSTSGYQSASGFQATNIAPVEEVAAFTICAKLKKPEIVLFADPNNKNSRVLVLKADVLFDYNRNQGFDNISASVLGFQILSCIYGRRKQTAYMVLQPCDAEYTQVTKSLNEGTMMKAVLSPVELRVSAGSVHTVSDVINELTTNMKVEECLDTLMENGLNDPQNLWVPEKISMTKWLNVDNYPQSKYSRGETRETLTINVPTVQIICELEEGTERIPVLILKAAMEATVYDMSKQMHMKSELQLEISYFNEKLSAWEPLLEPVMERECECKPFEIIIKIFRQRAQPIASFSVDYLPPDENIALGITETDGSCKLPNSESSGSESDSDTGMAIIKRKNKTGIQRLPSQKSKDTSSLIGYPVDSDSENEEGIFDKIAHAFGHIFSSESSEAEGTDSEEEVGTDVKSEGEDETDAADPDVSGGSGDHEDPVFLRKEGNVEREDSVDSGVDLPEEMATYVIVDSRDRLEVTLTPTAMSIIKELAEAFGTKSPDAVHCAYKSCEAVLELRNKVGPKAKICIIEKSETGEPDEDRVVQIPTEDMTDEVLSPNSTEVLVDISPENSDMELEGEEVERFSISSALTQVSHSTLIMRQYGFEEADVNTLYEKTTRRRINIEVEGFEKLQCLLPPIESSHVFPLHPLVNNTRYHVVVDIIIHHAKKTVIVRSPLQIKNHTNVALNLFYKKSIIEQLNTSHPVPLRNPFEENVCLATLQPDEVYSVPLFVAYHCKLFVQPTQMNYKVSTEGIWWQELSVGHNNGRVIQCLPNNDQLESNFFIKLLSVDGPKLKLPLGSGRLLPNYVIHLYPPLILHNQLPYEVELKFKNGVEELKLNPGASIPVFTVNLSKGQTAKTEVLNYLGIPWIGEMSISTDMDSHKPVVMTAEFDTEGGNKQLGISLHIERERCLDLYMYAPYWIVNKTGLPLQFRGAHSDVVYEALITEEPLLFRFKRHRSKKAKVRVYNSHWSSSFSLDTVGTSGVIICNDKEREKKYQILLNVTLSKMQLTKIITLMPYFMVVNNTQKHLRFMEENEKADLWIDIAPSQCVSFWPDTSMMKMSVKFRDSDKVSQHFFFSSEHTTVLRMDNGSALSVNVRGGVDTPMTVMFFPYNHGDAPLRIDNACEDLVLRIHQKSLGQVMLLSPYQRMLYTWDDPTVERTLFWNVYHRNKPGIPIFFNKDGYGSQKVSFQTLRPASTSSRTSSMKSSSEEEDNEIGDRAKYPLSKKTRKDKVTVYWVSYLDGHQRVIFFTQDERIAKQARKEIDSEHSKWEFFCSFLNIGLSLVNNAYEEVAYFSLSSSPAIWEVELNGKWKLLTLELSTWLEDKWKIDASPASLKDFIQVDLSKMQMTKPFFGPLRRSLYPAFWCHYRQSQHQFYFHVKIHRIQIDNQLNDAVFPVVLYPSSIPSAVFKKSGPKPCIEMKIMQRYVPDLKLTITKYLKLLIQEFNLKIDKGFVLSLYDVFEALFTPVEEDAQLKADLTAIHRGPRTGHVKISVRPHQGYIEHVHLCPIKLKFSFSPRGTVHKTKPDPDSWQQDILNFFLNSIGATLTEVKDVELKMAYYDKKGALMTSTQLYESVKSHFYMQLVQQVYVLILGLDVLGNPYGLVKDFTQGFGDFFYEPLTASIQGPEEFAEGIAAGVRSLLGHVVGSTAGSVSLITGSLGQALAVLSFDEDYKRKRRQRIQSYRPLPDSIMTAGKGFVLGVILGLSGLFVKPVTGTQLEGVEGFFKGIGKGLMGLITKPTGGIVDMVSMAFDGIRRVAEMGENVVMRNRLPRHLSPTQGVKPYSSYMATGRHLLLHLSRGHYTESDIYFAHTALKKDDRSDVALITDRSVFLLEKCRLWGGWDIQWMVPIDDIMSVPTIFNKQLIIKVRQNEAFNLYSGDERIISSDDVEVLKWLRDKIEKVLLFNMADKPCPLSH